MDHNLYGLDSSVILSYVYIINIIFIIIIFQKFNHLDILPCF